MQSQPNPTAPSANRYSVRLTYTSPRPGPWPKIAGKILEGNVWVGEFARAAPSGRWIPPITYKFFSQAARNRFDDFADSLSIEETIEALLPNSNKEPANAK